MTSDGPLVVEWSCEGPEAVTTGFLNVGKLLSSNWTVCWDTVSASDMVGMICDASERYGDSGGSVAIPSDIVGSCEIVDCAE